MKFEKNTLEDGTYLVYRVKPEEVVDRYALNTISNNTISGVLKMNRENDNGVECFYINVTAKYPLTMLLDKPVRREFLLSIFESIAKTTNEADEYLLNPKYFLFNFENIYYDLSEKRICLIYLPIEREEEELEVRSFLRKMLYGITYDLREDCNYVAQLLNLMNSKELVTMSKLLDVIANIRKRIIRVVPPQGKTSSDRDRIPVETPPKQLDPSLGSGGNMVPGIDAGKFPDKDSGKSGTPVGVQGQKGSIPPVQPPKNDQITGKKKGGILGSLFGGKESDELKDNKGKNDQKNEQKNDQKKGWFSSKGKDDSKPQIPMPGRQDIAIPGMNIPGVDSGEKNKQLKSPDGRQAPQLEAKKENQPPIEESINKPNNSVGHTVIIGGAANDGKTVFKKDLQKGACIAQLTRTSTNETATIKSNPFKIGKEKSYVDFFVSANQTVSRIHAQIHNIDGNYFLEDINSTNHSFLGNDTTPIQSGQMYPLQSGMRFRLSDEEFVFKIK